MSKYKVVDLFAGAGGLSLGFMQTGCFDVKVAFENNPNMQKTYRENHKSVKVLGDVCKADYEQLKREYGKIDVVIGGPPCQGFSNANRQKNHAISKNNMLVKQYLRAIIELDPKAFVMENVSMLHSDIHRFFLTKEDVIEIKKYKIPMRMSTLQLLENKYLFQEALQIVQDKEIIRQNLWEEKYYTELNIIYKALNNLKKAPEVLSKHKKSLERISLLLCKRDGNSTICSATQKAFDSLKKYFEKSLKKESLKNELEPAIMYQRMLSKALEIFDNDIAVDRYTVAKDLCANINSFAVFDYVKGVLTAHGYVLKSDVLCAADYGAPQKRMRFILIGVKEGIVTDIPMPKKTIPEDSYRTVYEAISDIEDEETVYNVEDDIGTKLPVKSVSNLATELRDYEILRNHIITKTTDVAMERFKAIEQGKNFHSLEKELKENTYTNVERTQNTIYLRLKYDEPCGTVVNVRKSMWIHPIKDRAISIREAARLQTFPDHFIFYGTKDQQYQQVGNAVPPMLAKAIAMDLANILKADD